MGCSGTPRAKDAGRQKCAKAFRVVQRCRSCSLTQVVRAPLWSAAPACSRCIRRSGGRARWRGRARALARLGGLRTVKGFHSRPRRGRQEIFSVGRAPWHDTVPKLSPRHAVQRSPLLSLPVGGAHARTEAAACRSRSICARAMHRPFHKVCVATALSQSAYVAHEVKKWSMQLLPDARFEMCSPTPRSLCVWIARADTVAIPLRSSRLDTAHGTRRCSFCGECGARGRRPLGPFLMASEGAPQGCCGLMPRGRHPASAFRRTSLAECVSSPIGARSWPIGGDIGWRECPSRMVRDPDARAGQHGCGRPSCSHHQGAGCFRHRRVERIERDTRAARRCHRWTCALSSFRASGVVSQARGSWRTFADLPLRASCGRSPCSRGTSAHRPSVGSRWHGELHQYHMTHMAAGGRTLHVVRYVRPPPRDAGCCRASLVWAGGCCRSRAHRGSSSNSEGVGGANVEGFGSSIRILAIICA